MIKLTTLTAVVTLAAGLVFSAQTFAGEELELDNFKCYTARIANGEVPDDRRIALLSDQFDGSETTNNIVAKVSMFCTPVDKDGQEIIHPKSHLVCYSIKHGSKPHMNVLVTNAFGEKRLSVRKSAYFCIPSTMEILGED